jgi:hypothetical protein
MPELQLPLEQSAQRLHACPLGQGLHGPPQSMPVSVPV